MKFISSSFFMSELVPFDHAAFRQDCIDRFRAMSNGELLWSLAAIWFDRWMAWAKMTYIGRLFGEIQYRWWDMSNIKTERGWAMSPCTLRNNVMIKIDIGMPNISSPILMLWLQQLQEKGAIEKLHNAFMVNETIKELAKKRTMEFYEADLYNV